MLGEAIDDLDPSRIALQIFGCKPVKKSRVNADVNGLNSASVSAIPPDLGRLARRSQSEISGAAERATPAISVSDLCFPRPAASGQHQPGVWRGRNLQVRAVCGLQADANSQVFPIRSRAD